MVKKKGMYSQVHIVKIGFKKKEIRRNKKENISDHKRYCVKCCQMCGQRRCVRICQNIQCYCRSRKRTVNR